MAEATFSAPRFQDADKAREHLEALRWPTGAICPHCGGVERNSKIEGKSARPGLYFCGDCRTQFTVTVGTVFERSKIALNVWLQAVHLMCASKKGVSAKQVERMIGVTYKTAWFMCHRIREAMKSEGGMLGGPGKPVEVDETYWGTAPGKTKRPGWGHKLKIVSLVQRDGEKRSFHVANVTADTLRPILTKNIERSTHLMTDEARVYNRLGPNFRVHSTVNHSAGEYSRGNVTTNTVESSFAILKRGLYGTFHNVSEQHLQRYATEFDFRWNHRAKLGYSDAARADVALKNISSKRLTYRRTKESQAA